MIASQLKHSYSRFLLLVVIAFGLLILVTGYKMLVADIYSWKTSLFISSWQDKREPPVKETAEIAEQAALNAIEHSPVAKHEHYAKLGKVYEWQFYHLDWDDVEAQPIRLKSIEAFRQQTELAPSWPYAWLNLLRAKTQLKQIDNEFELAFDKVEETGNNHTRVILALAQLGSQNWSHLPQKYRSKTIQAISFSASQSSANAKQLRTQIYDAELLNSTCWYAKAKQIEVFGLCKS